MRKIMILMVLFCFISNSFALSIDQLLEGYAKNDTKLKELLINLDQQTVQLQKIYITHGVNVNLTTGNSSVSVVNGETIFSTIPKLTVDIPGINSSIVATTATENTELKSASIEFSTAIIDSVSNEKELAIETAERDVELAQRAIENQLIEVQVAFYNDLKTLYSKQNVVSSSQDDVIEALEDFELVKTQGYAPNSVKYRTDEISVKTAEWNLEENQRTLKTELNNFLIDCGFELDAITEIPSLPASIENIAIDSISDYDTSDYIKLEETLWRLDYEKRKQENQNDFTLNADLGLKYFQNQVSNINENSASVGLSGAWSGLNFSTGVEIPFENTENLKLNFGLTWDLQKTNNHSLEKDSDDLENQLNTLTEQNALDELEKQIQNSVTNEKDLAWQKENKLEQLDLYNTLYIDTQEWFEQGLVSSSDVLKAKTDYERALIGANESLIDIVIHNLELSQLFLGA